VRAANGNGTLVVGGSYWLYDSGGLGNGAYGYQGHATVWTSSGGGYSPVSLHNPSWDESYAYGVSNSGTVVAGYASANGNAYAYRWELNSQGSIVNAQPIGGLAYGSAVSGNGAVIGGEASGMSGRQAAVWDSNGAHNLGYLDDYYASSWVNGLNYTGSVAVGASMVAWGDFSARHAVVWNSGTMTDIGVLARATPYSEQPNVSEAFDISADGSVVVGTSGVQYEARNELRAFVWRDGVMYDVKELLIAQGVDREALAPWRLVAATGISDDGLTIVGYGLYNGNYTTTVAWSATLLPVPEPATIVLFGCGLFTVAGLARRGNGRTTCAG
jgi:probable HAF family extracellular repeat protein